jgi:hypothetical protein
MGVVVDIRKISAVAVVPAFMLVGTQLSASANDADVIRRGSCSGAADWKLKASPENGRIEVEGEVDSNRNGQTWKWRIKHDGSVTARGRATTKGPSGSFERRRVVANSAGRDRIGWRAVNVASGQTCSGHLFF